MAIKDPKELFVFLLSNWLTLSGSRPCRNGYAYGGKPSNGGFSPWRAMYLKVRIAPVRRSAFSTISRSPSEEFISGEVWFGSLRLKRIQDEAKASE